MADWAEVFGNTLGVSAPATISGAVYTFFSLVDKKSSAEAREAMTKLLRGERLVKKDVREVMLNLFDRIYGYPLYRTRAIIISGFFSVFSIAAWIAFMAKILGVDYFVNPFSGDFQAAEPILFNVVSDYACLYIVRFLLIRRASVSLHHQYLLLSSVYYLYWLLI